MTVRLEKREIRELDKLCGAMGQTRSDFLREFLGAALSNDMERIHTFLGKMIKRAAEKHQAALPGLLEAPIGPGRRKGRGSIPSAA